MQMVFNNSVTFAFKDELQKAAIKSTTLPQICCHTTLENLTATLQHN